MSVNMNKKLTPREGMNFMQRVFTKVSPAQLEAVMLMFISGFAAFMIFRNDIVMPGYSRVVQGDRESYGSDPVDTYKMEPIFDENGKLKAMRKIRIKPTTTTTTSNAVGNEGENNNSNNGF